MHHSAHHLHASPKSSAAFPSLPLPPSDACIAVSSTAAPCLGRSVELPHARPTLFCVEKRGKPYKEVQHTQQRVQLRLGFVRVDVDALLEQFNGVTEAVCVDVLGYEGGGEVGCFERGRGV